MKKHLKMSQSLPTSGHSPAGNAHVPMTDEEKMRQRNRLLRTPAPVKERASRFVACWITDQLAAYGLDPFNGPFSEKEMNGCKVELCLTDETPLMLMVNAIGFCTVGGYLGMSQSITDGAAAWVHCREKDNEVSVSTQYLFVDPAVYTNYQGQEAFNASVNSYGGTSKGSAQRSSKPNQPRNATGNTGH